MVNWLKKYNLGFESKELAVKLKRDKVDLKDPLSSTRSKVKKNIHIKGSSGIKNLIKVAVSRDK